MDIPQLASRVRFVLCEPAHPGNIGSAARAIKTMGFRDLRVVAPREPGYRTHEEAVAYATSSVDVLEASACTTRSPKRFEGRDLRLGAHGLRPRVRSSDEPPAPRRRAFRRLARRNGGRHRLRLRHRAKRHDERREGHASVRAAPPSPPIQRVRASTSLRPSRSRPKRCTWRSWPPKGMTETPDWQSRFEHTSSLQALRPSREFFRHWGGGS